MFHFPKHIAAPEAAPDIIAPFLRKCQHGHIRVSLSEATTHEHHLHTDNRFVETYLHGKLQLAASPRPVWFAITFVTLFVNDDTKDTELSVQSIDVFTHDDTTNTEITVFPHPANDINVYEISDIDTVLDTAVAYLVAAANNAAQS